MRGLVLFFKVHLYSGNHLEINIQVFQLLYLYCIYLIFRFFFLLTIHNLNAVYILFSFVLMPRRAFPFFFRTMCCRCLHPVGRISPQRVSQGLIFLSLSFRKSTRRNGFVKFSPPTSPSATLANPFPSAYSTKVFHP